MTSQVVCSDYKAASKAWAPLLNKLKYLTPWLVRSA
jgi:hypothetical protein